ncbi:aminoglycoside adenylyltransferase domain-containing protein [Nocardioides sp. MAHUQ-72]|uniref:aminoglycoside adenylyltransferase domain-containing protein n=1 Tax=unclassified Nocardioides TaxID=2615069 RepID=UPI003620C683
MPTVFERLAAHLDAHDPGGVLGLYLYGSSVAGGLRPDSDLDLLLVTERPLGHDERAGLLDLLLQFSGRRATVEPGRPVELTSVVRDDLDPWTYPPRCDFLYGEWLRAVFVAGRVPEPHARADLAVLLTTLAQHAQVLRGPSPGDLLPAVPVGDLCRALHDSLPSLLDNLAGDERNVLLTLARMVVTLESGEIVSKDEAARRIRDGLPEEHHAVLSLAAAGYVGEREDDWTLHQAASRATAAHLAERIRPSR